MQISATNNNIEQCAYHESGHIVMAYLSRFSCEGVAILQDGSGDGYSKFNYGHPRITELVAAIVSYQEHPQFYHSLSPEVKSATEIMAYKMCGTLIGGAVSEALYKAGPDFIGDLPVEFSGPDLLRINSIQSLLSQIVSGHPRDYVEEQMTGIILIMQSEETWKAIEELASAIINAPSQRLSKTEIEQSLSSSGYLAFIVK